MKIFFLTFLMLAPLTAGAALNTAQLSDDESAFQELSDLYRSSTDRTEIVSAFDKFLKKYPNSQRAPDAQFMQGEAYMANGLEILRKEKLSKMSTDARIVAGANPLGRFLSAFLAAFWLLRVFLQFVYYDRALRAKCRLGDIAYTLAISSLSIVYSVTALGVVR